ncbi:MAG: hypothetical protein WDO13_10675 [Verrucomicrobiota bacterium]
MDADFADIRIVSFEDELTVVSPTDPKLRYLYLKLSATPPPGWVKHFAQSRKVARHPRWRNAWIDRKFIVVECVPEELEDAPPARPQAGHRPRQRDAPAVPPARLPRRPLARRVQRPRSRPRAHPRNEGPALLRLSINHKGHKDHRGLRTSSSLCSL